MNNMNKNFSGAFIFQAVSQMKPIFIASVCAREI